MLTAGRGASWPFEMVHPFRCSWCSVSAAKWCMGHGFLYNGTALKNANLLSGGCHHGKPQRDPQAEKPGANPCPDRAKLRMWAQHGHQDPTASSERWA